MAFTPSFLCLPLSSSHTHLIEGEKKKRFFLPVLYLQVLRHTEQLYLYIAALYIHLYWSWADVTCFFWRVEIPSSPGPAGQRNDSLIISRVCLSVCGVRVSVSVHQKCVCMCTVCFWSLDRLLVVCGCICVFKFFWRPCFMQLGHKQVVVV